MTQIPALTQAIERRGYICLKDLANAVLDAEEENNKLAAALSDLVNSTDLNFDFNPTTVKALETARNLLAQRRLI